MAVSTTGGYLYQAPLHPAPWGGLEAGARYHCSGHAAVALRSAIGCRGKSTEHNTNVNKTRETQRTRSLLVLCSLCPSAVSGPSFHRPSSGWGKSRATGTGCTHPAAITVEVAAAKIRRRAAEHPCSVLRSLTARLQHSSASPRGF